MSTGDPETPDVLPYHPGSSLSFHMSPQAAAAHSTSSYWPFTTGSLRRPWRCCWLDPGLESLLSGSWPRSNTPG